MSPRSITVLTLGTAAWLACLAAGFAALQEYAGTAGDAREPVSRLDATLARYHQPGRGLVVMAVHPGCPCTDASLGELGDMLARSGGTCDALILEHLPLIPPADWPKPADHVELAGRNIPVIQDRDGELASALGAKTSGHAVFVDAKGEIRFHGGITLSRGHRGRSPAQNTILAMLAGQPSPGISRAPVYGCALEAECKVEPNR